MSKYAIIQVAGKQHKITEGETLVVDRLATPANETVTVTDVLLVNDGKSVSIGAPLVKGASVVLKVVNHELGEKLRVATYKAKSRYRRVRGHRQRQTTLEVVSIQA